MANSSQDQSEQSQDYRQYQESLELTVEDWQRILHEGGIDAVLAKKNEIDEQWRKIKVLIGVIGQTGSGKSTLIGRLLGIPPDDESGPPIGEGVTPCTLISKEYPKADTGLIYIDLPGVGCTTETFAFNTPEDQAHYCENFGLQSIDYFLLVSDGKLNDQEKFLIEYITKELKKNFSFLQTKMDSLRREHGTKSLEKRRGFEAVKKNIRADIKNNLAVEDDKRIFLISNDVIEKERDGEHCFIYDDSSDYEFDSLMKQIQDDMQGEDGLPTKKGEAFIFATGAISKSAILATAKAFRNQIWDASKTSAVLGASPIPGTSLICDAAIIICLSIRCFTTFGLKPIDVFGEGNATQKVQNLINVIVSSMGARAATLLTFLVALDAAEEGIKFIPVIGTTIGCTLGIGISFFSTSTILNYVVDFCEMEALKLIEQSLKQGESVNDSKTN